jgi:hypothetical protein
VTTGSKGDKAKATEETRQNHGKIDAIHTGKAGRNRVEARRGQDRGVAEAWQRYGGEKAEAREAERNADKTSFLVRTAQ